ncbi:MAG TPA: hypothetical protein VFP64_05090 [Pyrinomonadaceae bacterium]|nr:hypothetical protein [Pyrinomonadaceae bacterium]
MISSSFWRVVLALALISQIGVNTAAQVCDREQAFGLIQEQIAQSKTLEKTAARISILTQGADLLWPYRQSAARSAFEEAFDVASQGDSSDQRFVVIRAIAQRDSEWARRLAKAIAEEKRSDEESGVSTDNRYQAETLLNVATSLLQNDSKTAISFARASLRYPASVALARFLFQLWAVDRQATSRFYQQALNVYANAPVNQLLYLSAYPFGMNRVVGPEMQSTFFALPKDFTPDAAAESAFLEVILRRGQETKGRPAQPVSGPVAQPEIVQIYLALNSLQALVTRDQPAFAGRVMSLVSTLEPLLSAEARHEASNIARWHQDLNLSLETIAERIENEKVPEKKDRLIARAVLAAKSAEELERVEIFVEKVSDSKFRGELLDWLYFKRTQKLVSDGRLDEAAQLIPKVSQVDHRAFLAFLLASESTKKIKDSVLVMQVLEDVVKTALKAPNTIEKARTLLGLTSSYAKFDRTRAFEILGEAINVINKIDEPDLTSTAVFRRIGTDRFTIHAAYEMRSSSLDTVFREFAIDDFMKSLWLANQLPDKPLRATGTFAISGRCLEIAKEPSQ